MGGKEYLYGSADGYLMEQMWKKTGAPGIQDAHTEGWSSGREGRVGDGRGSPN